MSRKLWVWVAVLAIAGAVVTSAGAATPVVGARQLNKKTHQNKMVNHAH